MLNPNELLHIIDRCKKNDRLAQEKVYRSFFGLFYTIAKDYVADKEEVLGIVNESFLKIFMNIDKYDNLKSPFEVWCRRIVNNTGIDAYRRVNRQPNMLEINDAVSQGMTSVQYHASINNQEMEKLFARLPNITGKVCRLSILEGYSHKEIAQLLGITESTSRWHLREGKIKLKNWLGTKI